MTVIQLEIDEGLIQALGAEAVKEFMERQLSMLRLEHLGGKIADAIRQAGLEHQVEVEEARQEAWQEYKGKYLKDVE
jgi:hypothetical protein